MSKKSLKDFALEIEYQNLSPKDFLYKRLGPWPQPSANHPFGEVPGVLHLPWQENLEWWLKVGSRYVRDMLLYLPIALVKSIIDNGLHELSDDKMGEIFFNTCYAKYLTEEISEEMKILFKDYIKPEHQYYIVDFSPMEILKPIKGVCIEKTISLFETDGKNVLPVAINLRDYIVTKNDGELWMYAKFCIMQGASVFINVEEHPKLHFPMDPINAITKTSLPMDHLLFKLIYPHLEISLKLNYQVLNNPISLLANKWWMDYAPFPATSDSLRELIVVGYSGIKGNPAFNKYVYPINGPRKMQAPFGKFHECYYPAYYEFAKNILAFIPKNDRFVTNWANYIHQQMPSFPNGKEIWVDDTFIKAVAVLLWDLTIGHGADHKTYSEIPVALNPMRLKVSAPKDKTIPFKLNLKSAVGRIDQAKWMVSNYLFYKPWNIKNLVDIDYGFKDLECEKFAKKFIVDLKKIEATLPTPNYMPVDEIPSSIQY
jgi:hypothetical protein